MIEIQTRGLPHSNMAKHLKPAPPEPAPSGSQSAEQTENEMRLRGRVKTRQLGTPKTRHFERAGCLVLD